MRYKGRTVLAALVAALALVAVTSASAVAAPPEFTLAHGKTFPLTIESELHAGTVTVETPTLFDISCDEDGVAGEISAAKAVSLTLELTGCSQKGETFHSEGAPAGHVVISGSGTLVYINEAKVQVGIAFTLKEVKIEASGGTKLSLSGSLVIPITPINSEVTSFNLPIHQTRVGKQEFSTYENERREVEYTKLVIGLGGSYESASIEMSGSNQVITDAAVTVATSVPPPLYLSAFGSEGIGNGQFSYPEAAAVAPNGDVYVADTDNNRLQEFSSAGKYIAQWGSQDPEGVAVASNGHVYVTEGFRNARVQEFSETGELITQWGSEGTAKEQFKAPQGVAVASNGDVYVADSQNHRVQEFSSAGKYITQWGSDGSGSGQFQNPKGIAVASNGDVYVTDEANNDVQEFSAEGKFITQWGSSGKENGQFRWPLGVAVGSNGEVFVADEGNDRVQEFSSTGVFTTKFGSAGTKEGQFSSPSDVAVAPKGEVYVVDKNNDRIQKFE